MNNQEAIDILTNVKNTPQITWLNGADEAFDLAIKALDRPVGEWLPNYTSQFRNPGRQCSLCGKVLEFSENFCPKCGAKMILDEEVQHDN